MEPPSTGDAKPYHCSVCGDDFKRHEHLIRHSRRHTQEKPFKCDVCQKEFARRDILSRHAIVHVPASERAALPQKAQKRGTKRVQQACNNCAKGKCRCDGETPCNTCQSKGLENCEYTLTSTPAKRRRADSSASTAAANVLLQVASSAHASPKGDWSMDYNDQHNDISMQPPAPVVFGYQPTLNGSMGHDPFMYNGSKPGSRYGSRAPSPAHAYDAPFENAMPANSIFGFLFKESAKDLPALNSILSNFLPAPGMIGDYQQQAYGHNGVDQPGTYSNYRNDYLTSNKLPQGSNGTHHNNNNNKDSTQPSSPTVLNFAEVPIPDHLHDLEESPLVETFTDADREKLESATELQLPSARLLNLVTQLYFDRFHESLPIIHRPNYLPGQADLRLSLTIMALGARYLEGGEELQKSLFALAQRAVKAESDSFPALQAHFLLDVAELYSIQSASSMEAVEERRAHLLRVARSRKLFDEAYDDAPSDDSSTDIRWQISLRAEERRRLSWAIWLHEHLFRVFFNARALLEIEEVRTSLPCRESLWEANTSQEWADQFSPDLMPLRTRTLLGVGRLEERGSDECSQYGTFCRTILAHVEARRVHDIEAKSLIASLQAVDESKKDVKAETSAEHAADMAEKTFEVLQDVLSSGSASESEASDGALNLHFARMTTCVDLRIIRQYLFGDDRGVRLWSELSQHRARAAVLAAAHIVHQSIERHSSPFAGMISFYATMLLFCFSRYYPGNESLQQIQLDKSEFGSPQAQEWIDRGQFIPLVQEIGPLEGSNTPRIVSNFSKSGIAYWGIESLTQRIESLAQFE